MKRKKGYILIEEEKENSYKVYFSIHFSWL